MTSSVFTIFYRGNPAQLIGFLWDEGQGDTGLAVIRVKGEGRFLRAVNPSKLTPIADLRPAAAPQTEEPNATRR